jgi:hypothetical protein
LNINETIDDPLEGAINSITLVQSEYNQFIKNVKLYRPQTFKVLLIHTKKYSGKFEINEIDQVKLIGEKLELDLAPYGFDKLDP